MGLIVGCVVVGVPHRGCLREACIHHLVIESLEVLT